MTEDVLMRVCQTPLSSNVFWEHRNSFSSSSEEGSWEGFVYVWGILL